MPRTFTTFPAALQWGKRYGRDHCHACDRWQVVRHGAAFAIAIVSINTGRTIAFVCPE